MRVEFTYNICGGKNVTRDAWAAWNADEQQWVLGAAFDYAFCHDCEEEIQLVERELIAPR